MIDIDQTLRMAAAILLVLSLGLGCHRGARWAERDKYREPSVSTRPEPVLTGAGLPPGRYRIVDVRVEAEPTQHGEPWDRSEAESGAAPDLQVEVRLDGKPIASCNGPQDSTFARCKLDLEIGIE